MTRAEFAKSLRSLSAVLDDLGILQQVYNTSPLKPSNEFRSYALSAMPRYPELFKIGLRNRDYNVLLNDYSYFQFAHSGEGASLSVRSAFYLNPFIPIDWAEFENLVAVLGYEDVFQLLDEQGENPRAIVVRYDVAIGDYVKLRHPASHFHFGLHEESRWAVDKVLTPLTFGLLIIKLFYLDSWSNDLDERLARAKSECAKLEAVHFSDAEKKQPHLT